MQHWRGAIVESSYLFRDILSEQLRSFGFEIIAGERTVCGVLELLERCDRSANFILWHVPADARIEGELIRAQEYLLKSPGTSLILLTDLPRGGSVDAWQARAEGQAGIARVLSLDMPSAALRYMLPLVLMEQEARSSGEEAAALIPPSAPTHIVRLLRDEAVPASPPSGDKPASLSDREQQILSCLLQGLSNKAIGRKLEIAEGTVKVHIKSVLRKIKARNRTQAAIWALDQVAKSRDRGEVPARDNDARGLPGRLSPGVVLQVESQSTTGTAVDPPDMAARLARRLVSGR